MLCSFGTIFLYIGGHAGWSPPPRVTPPEITTPNRNRPTVFVYEADLKAVEAKSLFASIEVLHGEVHISTEPAYDRAVAYQIIAEVPSADLQPTFSSVNYLENSSLELDFYAPSADVQVKLNEAFLIGLAGSVQDGMLVFEGMPGMNFSRISLYVGTGTMNLFIRNVNTLSSMICNVTSGTLSLWWDQLEPMVTDSNISLDVEFGEIDFDLTLEGDTIGARMGVDIDDGDTTLHIEGFTLIGDIFQTPNFMAATSTLNFDLYCTSGNIEITAVWNEF